MNIYVLLVVLTFTTPSGIITEPVVMGTYTDNPTCPKGGRYIFREAFIKSKVALLEGAELVSTSTHCKKLGVEI
jgi:hypothetical protein